MNLFVVGVGALSGDLRGERALTEVVAGLPFGPTCTRARWTGNGVMASMASHAPDQVGGVRYWAAADGHLALFSGRPVAPGDEEGAMFDGRAPLDARWFLSAPAGAASQMEGRFVSVVCRGDNGGVAVVTDPLGAYPVYELRDGEVRWVSNSAELLRRLAPGPEEVDLGVLAEVLSGGWSLAGHALWAGVRRIPPGRRSYAAGEAPRDTPLLSAEDLAPLFGAGLDTGRAAHTVAALTRALGDWPGRPSIVPVTGGRDSRVVLAATRAASLPWPGGTAGAADHPDATIGRMLCDRLGRPFSVLRVDGYVDRLGEPRRAAALVSALSGGTITLSDAAGFPAGVAPDPLPIWHTGQGGEIARRYYGVAGGEDADSIAERLHAVFAGRAPGRREPLTPAASAGVRDRLRAWVAGMLDAGVRPADVPDAFYLLRRMGTWSAPGHGCVEPIRDATSPLWSRALLPDLLGASAEERGRERFHRELVARLAPALLEVPFEDGERWDSRPSGVARAAAGARRLGDRAGRELARRRAARRSPSAQRPAGAAEAPGDRFARLQALVGEALHGEPWHPIWDVLDRAPTEQLLTTPPDGLDPMRRYYLWRIASVALAS
ncbi:MAG: hypothetical protein U0T02_14600 [Solirubrobacteraceae bacterium]